MLTFVSFKYFLGVFLFVYWFEEVCSFISVIYNEFVYVTGFQGGFYSFGNYLVGSDVIYKLGDVLGVISFFF